MIKVITASIISNSNAFLEVISAFILSIIMIVNLEINWKISRPPKKTELELYELASENSNLVNEFKPLVKPQELQFFPFWILCTQFTFISLLIIKLL
jgi:hypothetical protein